MKKNYKIFLTAVDKASGKSTKSSHSIFAENLNNAKRYGNRFKYYIYNKDKFSVSLDKITKLK